MDLGLGLLTAQRRPDDDRSTAAIYDELLELGAAADRAGLDSVWTSEHHFADDGYLSGTVPTMGALAGRTDEIRIGSAVALAPFYDAVRLAEDAATIAALSDDRLTLGLSIAYWDREFENFGIPKAERTARTEDAIAVLRNAWSPGPLEYDPDYHAIDPATEVTPTPDEAPPIVLGGLAKPAVRRAARLGDGWCANEMLSLEDIRTRMDDIERVREEEGLDGDFTTYIVRYGFVGDSADDAWETMRDGYFYQQRKYAEWMGDDDIEALPDERKRELKEDAIVGSPDQVRAELETYREELGDDVHIIFRSYCPGIDTAAMQESIERLGREVAPEL
ncbi:LLM class flavin-dependent oxidoreductase [Natrinema salifodinae]|uniref:Flavin-dependent oxidoreductase, luciferase family (Includes alkanesulfonate monooxygenase SsuD and methylene tetrahydromethanopterin reductase) n=1 Tax=Natrinema salifodinae TaxID=1202768 RepID=A0A1I0PT99_9EURY|nr:LLM class flavin-dependent oxidoreductase [Natrinema salifodinae]SEW17630.1 Flavin-dependent oxidoreductase, luciferase family (includes alkanesulfonate monooxygenase SsuD and methylene tetrahydromethanopterin reductase) [Natrinema salifodinae]